MSATWFPRAGSCVVLVQFLDEASSSSTSSIGTTFISSCYNHLRIRLYIFHLYSHFLKCFIKLRARVILILRNKPKLIEDFDHNFLKKH